MSAKIMKKFLLLLFLVGCSEVTDPWGVDTCLKHKLFIECLEKVPQGPTTVKYNDWSEVIEECKNAATGMSYRKKVDSEKGCWVH